MSISQFMASGAALATTANNQVLVNNATMEGSFFNQFNETISASLEATNSAAQETQEYLTDQARSQEAQAIGNMVGGAGGTLAAFGGVIGGAFSSSAQTDPELEVKIGSAEDEVATIRGTMSTDSPTEESCGVIQEDETASFSGKDTNQTVDNAQKIAKNNAAAQATTTTENNTSSESGSKSDRFYQSASSINNALSSVGGVVGSQYTLDQAGAQAAAGLFTGIAQALNSNTGVITSALQARDSSSATVGQLNSTLIHASGGVAG